MKKQKSYDKTKLKIECFKKMDSDRMFFDLLIWFDPENIDKNTIKILKKNFNKNVKGINRNWYRILLSNGEWLSAYVFGRNY